VKRSAVVIAAAMTLALAAASVCPPVRDDSIASVLLDPVSRPTWRPVWVDWEHWYEPPFDSDEAYQEHDYRVDWPVLIAEQALILLLGGGLPTLVVRRERRRSAATA
jgi:hypothetical protein